MPTLMGIKDLFSPAAVLHTAFTNRGDTSYISRDTWYLRTLKKKKSSSIPEQTYFLFFQ